MYKVYALCFCGLYRWWINVDYDRVISSCHWSNKPSGSAVNLLAYEEGCCPMELGA
jgi:hypothetical protein